jgi:hypothetical protein
MSSLLRHKLDTIAENHRPVQFVGVPVGPSEEPLPIWKEDIA